MHARMGSREPRIKLKHSSARRENACAYFAGKPTKQMCELNGNSRGCAAHTVFKLPSSALHYKDINLRKMFTLFTARATSERDYTLMLMCIVCVQYTLVSRNDIDTSPKLFRSQKEHANQNQKLKKPKHVVMFGCEHSLHSSVHMFAIHCEPFICCTTRPRLRYNNTDVLVRGLENIDARAQHARSHHRRCHVVRSRTVKTKTSQQPRSRTNKINLHIFQTMSTLRIRARCCCRLE